MNSKIKVNIIAGSGAYHGPESWIFSDMIDILMMGIDISKFDINITPEIDESQQYDVYHYFHSTLAVQNNGKMSHRALVTIHAMSDLEPNWSFEYKEPYLMKARKISSVSTSIIDTLVNRGIDPNKISYTPAGVDLESFQPTNLEDRYKLESELNIKSDIVRFGIVSRRYNDGRKGEDFLKNIINHFSDPEKYRFMFVGSGWGEFLNSVTKELELNPTLFELFERGNNCTYEDYPSLYGAMDIVLVTSKVDSGPVCILESLAKGIPVVSTPTGLANELLIKRFSDENLNYVIQYGDVYSFIDAMYSIIAKLDKTRMIEWKNNVRDIIINPNQYTPINKYSNSNSYTWDNFCRKFEDIYEEIYHECCGKIFVEDFMGDETQKQFISLYSSQASSNLTSVYLENYQQIKPYAKDGIGIVNFKDLLKNKPAVIVGAGPSLDKDISVLQKYQGTINIFACDAALPVLNKNNIKPDVVIVADPSDRQVQNFSLCNGAEFITILPTIVHPMTFQEARKHDCILLWYNIADGNIDLCKWIPKEIGYKGLVRPGVLTSSMVYQIALYMGCGPITFIGHDLSWNDINKGYATGVSDQKIVYQYNNKMINKPVFLFPDISGKLTITDLGFINFIQWINAFLKEYEINIYNSTECGILYGENIVQMNFSEWCEKYHKPFDIPTFNLLYQFYRNLKNGNDVPIIPNI